jgi:probable phosphoglycerate mutase
MHLYFIRHAESAYNAEGRIQGQTDIGLSARGLRQAHALALALATHEIDAIYASPLQRAHQTAAILAQQLELPVRTDPRLQEIHAGIFQGLLWSEIRRSHPSEAERWLAQEPDFVIPGGESRRELGQRGRAALETIRAQGHRAVAVVSHGGLLAAAIKELLEIPADRIPFQLLNASITRAVWQHELRLETLNQIEHLLPLEEPASQQVTTDSAA